VRGGTECPSPNKGGPLRAWSGDPKTTREGAQHDRWALTMSGEKFTGGNEGKDRASFNVAVGDDCQNRMGGRQVNHGRAGAVPMIVLFGGAGTGPDRARKRGDGRHRGRSAN